MNSITHIPFRHLDRDGIVRVDYLQNPDPITSGFDAMRDACKQLNFDVDLCTLYPTVNAAVERYDGTGYRKLMGWIQFIVRCDILNGVTNKSTSIDGGLGNPFFAMGYPPELYDAPMYNLGNSDKLIWIAEAFLTTVPTRMNDHTIQFLAGFQWGYEEFDIDGVRNVNILPVNQIDGYSWNNHIPLLNEKFSSLNYAEYTV